MSQGQVAGGYDDDESRSTGWLLIIGVAVIAALLSLVTHHTSSGASPQPPAPSAFAQPTPSASASALPSDEPSAQPSASSAPPSAADPTQAILSQIGGYVSVGEVCTPLTDGRNSLTVRFLLRNVSGLSEHLLAVTPELPMGGLTPRGATVQNGDCGHPVGKGVAPSKGTMPQGGTLVVSLRFGLPHSCPAPYPVQAVVRIGIAGQQRTDTVAIYTDLGTVPFDLCKDA